MQDSDPTTSDLSRRACLRLAAAALAIGTGPADAAAAPFPQWVDTFKSRALARGVSEATYTRVMRGIKPDTSVYALDRSQPEFTETLWQYLNRRGSDRGIPQGRGTTTDTYTRPNTLEDELC